VSKSRDATPRPHSAAPDLRNIDIYELLPVATCIGDVHGTVFYGNAAFRELFRWDPSTRPSIAAIDILDDDGIGWLTDLEHRLVDGEFNSFESTMRFHRLDGTPFRGIVHGTTFSVEGRRRQFSIVTITPTDTTDLTLHDPFRRALESQNALICEWTPDGTILFTNIGYRQFFGYSESIVGRNINEFVKWEDGRSTASVIDSLSSGIPNETITRPYDDGRSVEWTNTLLRANDGDVISIISVGRDVTDREAARAELVRNERRFRAMITHIWDSIILLDAHGQVIESTMQFRSDLDYPPEYWERIDITSLVHPDDRTRTNTALRELRLAGFGAAIAIELRAIRAGGEVSWLMVNGVNLLDDPAVGALVLTVRNIDERKRFELELEQREAEARLALRSKLGFIAKVSHELRNPLHGMLALSELLDQSHLPVREAKAAAALHRQSGVLRRIVDDLLDIAQLEIGNLRIRTTRVDLSDVLSDAVTVARGTVPIGVTLTAHPVPPELRYIVGDDDRLRQMVANLVSNALKHTTVGEVSIDVSDGQRPNSARISVNDSGSGIDPDDIQRLFEPYERGRGEGTAGVGLGLAIVKGLAEQMQGAVGAARRPEGGSLFWIELPLSTDVEQAHPATRARPTQSSGLRVLVIDDDPVNLLVATMQLGEFGAQVTEAADGETAWDILQSQDFDVLFVDVQLPGISGLEVVQRMRARPGNRQPLIAVMTASATSADHQAALDAGADTFVPKPATLADIGAALGIER
jgi:PAS domain S-box-containing protein